MARQEHRAPPGPGGGVSVGWAGVAIGLVGLFAFSFLLSPLALLCGLIALLRLQLLSGFLAIVLSIGGIVTSPVLMGVLGLGALVVIGAQAGG